MKIIQSRHSALQRTPQNKTIQNKENEPVNALHRLKQGKKIGQEIKHKITKMSQQESRGILSQRDSNLIQQPLQDQQSILSLSKSVSFDSADRADSPALLRHHSKKSILKKSFGKLQSSFSLKTSQVSLANSHVATQDQSTQHLVGNKAILQKYERILEELMESQRKYKDEVYPPVQSSIYLHNSLMRNFCLMLEKQGRTVEWMRLPELFKHRQLTVWTSDKQRKCNIVCGPLSKSSDYLPGAFNLVGQKNSLLERMFEGQKVNENGIYFVKIHMTQQSIWKYVIIDDYVPVIVNKKLPPAQRYLPDNLLPAFLSVYSPDNQIQLWPFLLQKAYAKYYSTYDSLANGFLYDFVEEVAGVFMETQPTTCMQKVGRLVRNEDVMLLGEDRMGIFHPIKNSCESTITYLDHDCNFVERMLTHEAFTNKFSRIHYAYLHKYYLNSKCQVQQQHVRNSKQHQGFLLRHITIDQACECQMGVVQKQQRFFRALLSYEYAWMRLILVQQESSGYRWVTSAYSNHKTAKINAALTPGNYILIIIPEWRQKKYDFQLMYFGTTNGCFQRKSYEIHRNIIQQSCMDLAQRYGKMTQINKNLCSYHYIERKVGFMIENINNQKESGFVRVVRSIEGLQQYAIRPLNPQFSGKKTIQVVIPSMKHFTVVLMSTGGVQEEIFNMFDFGCHD